MQHPYGCWVWACSAAFGVFLAVLGALSPRVRIGDCMNCECECHCGEILPHEAMGDRLYWVEIVTGTFKGARCAAWRSMRGVMRPWVISADDPAVDPFFKDSEIRIIHEIIPED